MKLERYNEIWSERKKAQSFEARLDKICGGDYDQEEAKDDVAMPDACETAPIGGEFTSAVSMKNILKNNLEQTIKKKFNSRSLQTAWDLRLLRYPMRRMIQAITKS